jgi:hypothetical protein
MILEEIIEFYRWRLVLQGLRADKTTADGQIDRWLQ